MGSSSFVLLLVILLYLSKDTNAFSEELLATDGQFPFIVSIMYLSQHLCGGSLIARKAVVTNAKCCQQIQVKENARVAAGSLKPFSEEAHVRDVVHNSSYNHDICILILEEQLPQNHVISTVKTSSLYSLQQKQKKACTVIGWNSKIQLTFENVTANPCYNASKMLCAQSQHQGDAGSIIFCDGRLEGLLVKKQLGNPSFFIRLGLFKSWIEQSIRDSRVDSNTNRNHVKAFIISTLIPLILGLLLH